MVTQTNNFLAQHPFYRGFVKEESDHSNYPIQYEYNRGENFYDRKNSNKSPNKYNNISYYNKYYDVKGM